ncbi:hypothetical protein CL673_03990 [Candidatus Bathyarchaeota archaeon]|jgi:hypothetical protein|nr:hypothetical protein [Candidatus Bathyarchaeota archaeon]MDP6048719.1 hypothetical protein [Candidatus Bathyarchaeota archaeon]
MLKFTGETYEGETIRKYIASLDGVASKIYSTRSVFYILLKDFPIHSLEALRDSSESKSIRTSIT